MAIVVIQMGKFTKFTKDWWRCGGGQIQELCREQNPQGVTVTHAPQPTACLVWKTLFKAPFPSDVFYFYVLGCGHNKSKCKKCALS